MMRPLKPWAYGPFEILLHAELHYRVGEDFDRRIAMIGFDNAIEVAITTYLGLHPIQPGVVIPKLLQVRPGDLSCHQGIVVRDVGHGVVSTMLELNLQPLLELGYIEFRPVDAQ